MDRERTIQTILGLYPPDSQYTGTASAGREIVADICCDRWRELPDAILSEIATAMISLEQAEARKARL